MKYTLDELSRVCWNADPEDNFKLYDGLLRKLDASDENLKFIEVARVAMPELLELVREMRSHLAVVYKTHQILGRDQSNELRRGEIMDPIGELLKSLDESENK